MAYVIPKKNLNCVIESLHKVLRWQVTSECSSKRQPLSLAGVILRQVGIGDFYQHLHSRLGTRSIDLRQIITSERCKYAIAKAQTMR